MLHHLQGPHLHLHALGGYWVGLDDEVLVFHGFVRNIFFNYLGTDPFGDFLLYNVITDSFRRQMIDLQCYA